MQESLLPASGRMTFLAGLQSSGRHRYARYNGLPLRYAGGKSLAVGHILEHLPDDVELLASPFLGGGSVEIACAKELRMRVRGYDLFDVLANYWKVQLRSPMRLAETETAVCSAASTRSATSPFTTGALTTPRCAKFCGRTGAASSSPTTTAKPSENGILAAAYSRSSGNTHWARAKPESAKTASKTAPVTT